MGYINYRCVCGWTGTGDTYRESCPKCPELDMQNTPNPNAVAVNDSRQPSAFEVSVDPDVYQE